jgi:hypothetical protein
MKQTWAAVVMVFVVLGIGATLVRAETPKSRSVWVPAPTGSHLGGGFTSSGDSNNKSASKLGTTQENTALGTAVATLDAKADTVVDGYALLPTAVSWQTKVPVEVLKKQRATSGLTYGQLLVANSLASGSAKSFNQILALRAKTGSWNQLAENLHVSVKSIIGRINAADDSLKYAESRRRVRRDQNLNDNGLPRGNRIGVTPGG